MCHWVVQLLSEQPRDKLTSPTPDSRKRILAPLLLASLEPDYGFSIIDDVLKDDVFASFKSLLE